MRIITYFLVFILVFLSIFTIGYLVSNGYIGFPGTTNLQSALLSRFVEPKAVQSLHDLLDKLSSQGSGPMAISSDGQSLVYYDSTTGYLHKIDPTVSKDQDSSLQKIRPYLVNLQWSKTKDKILANDSLNTIFYDLNSGESKVLPSNIQFPVLSPLGDKLAYVEYGKEGDKNWLSISNTDLTSVKKLFPVAPGDWLINWIDKQTLSLVYSNLGMGSLMKISIDDGHLSRILSNLPALEINWSPDGQSLLYSYSNINKDRILSYKALGDSVTELNLPINAPASSCVWSVDNSSIFCPANKGTQTARDDGFVFLKISSIPQNLRMNNTSKIKTEDLGLSADEKYLFFRNAYTGSFYRLRIELDQ